MNNSIRAYLREIGRVPLLTQEQEIIICKQVQKMIALLEAKETLASILRREPTHGEWALHVHKSEAELKEALGRGQRAKRQMIEANLRLVVWVAKKYMGRSLEFNDLIQEGAIGLTRAVEKFDPTRGFKFSSYASWWIRQAITRAIVAQSRTIRLPKHVYTRLNQIYKAGRQLTQELGRTPTVAEIATKLDLTQKIVRQYLEWAQQPVSLNRLVGDDGLDELGELLSDFRATPEQLAIQSCVADDLERKMASLLPQQRSVLSLRFGLVDGRELTRTQISSLLNVSLQKVLQVELKAIAKLRQRNAASLTSRCLEVD